jgi:5'-3' exoribonuclease 1
MGVVRFYKWIKENYNDNLIPHQRNEIFTDKNVYVDTFMIDLNGIFHNSAQKIYEYGNHKKSKSLLVKNKKPTLTKQIKVFEDICNEIDSLVNMVNPTKELILCIDGSAPLSKQNQQRKRRYKSAKEKDEKQENSFDPNCMTPGTKFMDYMSKYIDWFIKMKINNSKKWADLKIVLSNEKCPGEGEQKIINYIRNYGNENNTYCIHGNDADIIMLAMGTKMPKFYILREDIYDYKNDYYIIDIAKLTNSLTNTMLWNSETKKFKKSDCINDFIFICFTVGNDFLPHIPSIEILSGGIDILIDIYKAVCTDYGHLTRTHNNKLVFIKKSVEVFMGKLGEYEKEMIEKKLNNGIQYFPDEILTKNTKNTDNGLIVDIKNYRKDYYSYKFPEISIQTICCDYLEGMQWVLNYYTSGVPSWRWCYKHHYAPFAFNLSENMKKFKFINYESTNPIEQFEQLLSVIPPKSSNLLPSPLNLLLKNMDSPIKKYCPDTIEVDLSGKKNDWEGVVLLPMVDQMQITNALNQCKNQIDKRDIKRNIFGKTFLYIKSKNYLFKSFYGDIENCISSVEYIDI